MQKPFSWIKQRDMTWPSGSDGALVITSGNTVTLSAGVTKDYSSIQIDAGGTLNIVGGAITMIGCRGSCVVDGIIRVTSNAAGTYSATSLLGESLSYTTAQNISGGKGGNAGYNGSIIGSNGSGGNGGKGADGDISYGGTGGGGGSKSNHGGGLFLYFKSSASGLGIIDCSGVAGGTGGSGGWASGIRPYNSISGGGGGGGGTGGSGGALWIRYKNSFSVSYSVSGGGGGAGGAGGSAANYGSGNSAYAGQSGNSGGGGNNGTSSIMAV